MTGLAALSWPAQAVGEAIAGLARRAGHAIPSQDAPPVPPSGAALEGAALGDWIEAVADWAGLEAEAVQAGYGEVGQLVGRSAPSLLRMVVDGETRFLALLRGGRGRVALLDPGHGVRRVPARMLEAALRAPLEAPVEHEVSALLNDVAVPLARRESARRAILGQRLDAQAIGGCWLLRSRPGQGSWAQARQAGLLARLVALVAAHTVQYLLWLLSWWMVGRGALEGRFERGWLLAWALLLVTLVPLQMLVTWLHGRVALGAGALLKRRLLAGTLRLEPEEVRLEGAGRFLGRVLESEAMEALALGGGLVGLVAGVELVLSAGVLALGPGSFPHALLLVAWTLATCGLALGYLRARRVWTATRLAMTHDLVERMGGQRTRLAQEAPSLWHEAEDHALQGYLDVSAAMDRKDALVAAVGPRGWLVVGLAALAPVFGSRDASPSELAVSVGGVLLAFGALRRLAAGLAELSGAAIAWSTVAPMFRAARRTEPAGLALFAGVAKPASPATTAGDPLLRARRLAYRYPGRKAPAVSDCSLEIARGERLLLESPSGAGKSTLASLLAGARVPEAGLVLLGGLDRASLGARGWRRRVVFAPQFHENHVFTGTFLFNALLGCPAPTADAAEVEEVCRGLGLSDLLERMPAGFLQMVGETGWQLSHGERSRLYLARALLQRAELVILDESFAALDPENLRRALAFTLARADTLLVVAHP